MAEPSAPDYMELKEEGAPPSYEATPSCEARQGAPPSYNQLLTTLKKDVREAKQRSPNQGMFALKFCQIMCESVLCTSILLLLSAIPISMIVIGSLYFDDCPDRSYIPIWLIVFGVFSLVQTVVCVLGHCCKQRRCGEEEGVEGGRRSLGNTTGRVGNLIETLIGVFLSIWFVVGSIWVFGYYNSYVFCTEYDLEPCCHPAPYLFSFVMIQVLFIFSIVFICFFCWSFVCIAFAVGLSDY